MHIRIKWFALLLASLLVVACGGGISGTYEGALGTIRFESGKAYPTLMTMTREMHYSTEGNKIILQSTEGNLVLTRNADGTIDTPWGTMKRSARSP